MLKLLLGFLWPSGQPATVPDGGVDGQYLARQGDKNLGWSTIDLPPAVTIHTGDNPPEEPVEGYRWFDTTTGIEYTYVTSNDINQWVEIGPGGGGMDGEDGAPAIWVRLTQAEYDALTPDPNTLYVVVG